MADKATPKRLAKPSSRITGTQAIHASSSVQRLHLRAFVIGHQLGRQHVSIGWFDGPVWRPADGVPKLTESGCDGMSRNWRD